MGWVFLIIAEASLIITDMQMSFMHDVDLGLEHGGFEIGNIEDFNRRAAPATVALHDESWGHEGA